MKCLYLFTQSPSSIPFFLSDLNCPLLDFAGGSSAAGPPVGSTYMSLYGNFIPRFVVNSHTDCEASPVQWGHPFLHGSWPCGAPSPPGKPPGWPGLPTPTIALPQTSRTHSRCTSAGVCVCVCVCVIRVSAWGPLGPSRLRAAVPGPQCDHGGGGAVTHIHMHSCVHSWHGSTGPHTQLRSGEHMLM